MNIVIPMAGGGTRLTSKFGAVPKPLIDVAGRPMADWALDSVRDLLPNATVVFVVLKEHDDEFNISRKLRQMAGDNIEVVTLDKITDGQLCTVLAAEAVLDPDSDLLICSCDTLVASDLANDIRERHASCRGIISVADMPGDRWSFARTDETGRVVEVAEKVRISNHASTGLYYFSSCREFISAAKEIVLLKQTAKGEYYIIQVYEKYIQHGMQVALSIASQMHDMGTSESLQLFVDSLARVKPVILNSDEYRCNH